jgi:branched-subunit amino acid transport protein
MTAWLTIALLAVGTFAIKAAGPATLGRRELPDRVVPVIALLPVVLLSSLVASDVIGDGFQPDAKLVGIGAAIVAVALRRPMIVVLIVAAAATAITRLLF